MSRIHCDSSVAVLKCSKHVVAVLRTYLLATDSILDAWPHIQPLEIRYRMNALLEFPTCSSHIVRVAVVDLTDFEKLCCPSTKTQSDHSWFFEAKYEISHIFNSVPCAPSNPRTNTESQLYTPPLSRLQSLVSV